MVVKIIVEGKIYEWGISEEEAKELINNKGGKKVKEIQQLSEGYVKKSLSVVDPYTIGLLVGGGLSALGVWIAYRFNKEQFQVFKKSIGIN